MVSLLILVVTAVASLLFSSPVHGDCPHGWEHFNESCYNFVQKERTWSVAEMDCIRHGSRLVKVDSKEENDFIRNYLINNGRYFYGYDMWMGGRTDGHGGWDWTDDTVLLPRNFQDWNGQPPSGSQDNMCLEFEADYSYHWNQDFCDDLSYSICERPIQPLTPPPPTGKSTTPTDTLVG